jgi:hypothetical protein
MPFRKITRIVLFIQSVKLHGKSYSKVYITTYADIANGGVMEMILKDTPINMLKN